MTFRVASSRIWKGDCQSGSDQETEMIIDLIGNNNLKNISKYGADWNNERLAYKK